MTAAPVEDTPRAAFDIPDVRCPDCQKKYSACNCSGPRWTR